MRLIPAGKKSGVIVHRSAFHLTLALTSNNFTRNLQSLSGIAVAAGASLCPEFNLDDNINGPQSLLVASGTYRGYLIDEASKATP